jgi:hypothetical protein
MGQDPRAEADFFLKQVAWQPGDVIVLDWEGYDAANKGVSRARQVAYRDAWLTYVKGKMPGHQVGMYCSTDYWRNVDTTGNCGDFLWIATAGAAAGQPGISYPWLFHQYSTAGGVDHDYCHLPSRDALRAWALSKETSVSLTKSDVSTLFRTDEVISSPDGAKDPAGNRFWTAESYLRYGYLQDRDTNALVKALAAKADKLATQVAGLTVALTALASKVGTGVDTAAVVTAVEQAIAAAVVHVDVAVTDNTPGA